MSVFRTKRDIEAEGPMHYTELTVDNATKLTTLDIPEGVSATEARFQFHESFIAPGCTGVG